VLPVHPSRVGTIHAPSLILELPTTSYALSTPFSTWTTLYLLIWSYATHSHPYHDGRSIGSIRRGNADGNIKESHHIFKSNGPDECRPFSCEPTGGSGCTCPPVIVKLKAQFEAAERYSTSAYSCTSGDFDGDTDRCFVPATTIGFGDPDFYCSMLARVEQFLPCDKTLISCSGTNPTGDAPPTTTPAPSGSDMPSPAGAIPTTPPAATSDSGVVVLTDCGPPYHMAITSWWATCTKPTSGDSAGTKVAPVDGPSVSFFTADNGHVLFYHLLFITQCERTAYIM